MPAGALRPVPAGGRPRKPTALKELAGTARKDRANVAEPRLQPCPIPPPPDDLTPTEREAWLELAAVVDPMRIATRADLEAFRQMVLAVAIVADARASLRAAGTVVLEEQTKAGTQVRARPEINIIATYQKLVLYHFSRWGLTPSDRSRVSSLAEEVRDDPLAEFADG